MKKLTLCLMATVLMLSFATTNANAGSVTEKAPATATLTEAPVDGTAMITRLNEIKEMDMSGLSAVNKRQLRKEVRSIEASLNKLDGGYVYVGGASLLLIILLIILLI
jgi:predicted aspartyl protease